MRAWGVMPSAFSRRSGVSRAHLLRLRKGEMEPTRRIMVELTETASLMRDRSVYVVELFELSRADEAIHQALISKGVK